MPSINSKIVSVEVIESINETQEGIQEFTPEFIHEKFKRPKVLNGCTYQLKTPLSECTWYITINNVLLNEGTEYEKLQPFEIFINTKDVSSYQWTIFASRMLSAIFRKGGDIKFILEEMSSVYQPNGGYLTKGGYMPSLVAEIGKIIETHFKSIGLIEDDSTIIIPPKIENIKNKISDKEMENAGTCPKCGSKSYIKIEGCGYCTNCLYSQCS